MSGGQPGFITQVQRPEDGQQTQTAPRKKWYSKLFFCFGSNDGSGARHGGQAGHGAHANTGSGQPLSHPVSPYPYTGEALLGPPLPSDSGRKLLVLDLDETLVHSSFKPVPNADFIIPVEIEEQVHQVYVLKRPHVDHFMKRMGQLFEIVVFTASLAKYADPVLDLLDIHKVVRSRLFREACVNHKGNYVKDLSRLGRPLNSIIIIDNSPASYLFHPENAVPIDSWFDDMNDSELLDLIPFLEDLTKVDDVCAVLSQPNG